MIPQTIIMTCCMILSSETRLERIVFVFGLTSLVILADQDDDTVDLWTDVSKFAAEADVSDLQLWKPHIGKPFGWGYIAVNQQGYCDGLLLGFGDIRPTVLLSVIASWIHVSTVVESSRAGIPTNP